MIPLLMLMIIMCSRYVQRKNLDEEAKENEIYLAELEQQRKKVLELLNKDQEKEAEIELFLEQQLKNEELQNKRPTHLSLNVVHEADISYLSSDDISAKKYDQDSTDDELFELPLPPIPIPSTSKIEETFNSDEDNPSNLLFSNLSRQYRQFPPFFSFPPPPQLPLRDSSSKETSFDPLVLPSFSSPISKVLCSNSSFNDTQKPKVFMQSDF